MANSTATRPSVRTYPPAACNWRWVERPTANPDTGASVGVLNINGTNYTFVDVSFVHDDGSAGRRFAVVQDANVEPYFIDTNPATGDLACTCADHVYRQGDRQGTVDGRRQCKHITAVTAAIATLDDGAGATSCRRRRAAGYVVPDRGPASA